MTRRHTPSYITNLEPHQVFVFGSNRSGFHGAGASGLAFRGSSDFRWREDPDFLAAVEAPPGSLERVGRWAVYGVAEGYQEGWGGKSYAIVTIERPGRKRSVSLSEIESQIHTLCNFALSHPELEFLVTRIGCNLAGYSEAEIARLWRVVDLVCLNASNWEGKGIPDNVILPECFECRG